MNQAPPPTPRRRLTAQERRAEILDAALQVLHVSLIEMHAGELFERVAASAAPGPDAAERRDEAIAMIVGSAQSLANWWHDHQEVPRGRLVGIAMELLWLGLDRLRSGERLPGVAG